MRQVVLDSECLVHVPYARPIRLSRMLTVRLSAFKFLPVLGKHIANCFERKATPELQAKWAARRSESGDSKQAMSGDGSRGGPQMRVLTGREQAKL